MVLHLDFIGGSLDKVTYMTDEIEACDDENSDSEDGCSATCTVETDFYCS